MSKLWLLHWFWYEEGHDYDPDYGSEGILGIVDNIETGKQIANKVAQETLLFRDGVLLSEGIELEAICSASVHYRLTPYVLNTLPVEYPKP